MKMTHLARVITPYDVRTGDPGDLEMRGHIYEVIGEKRRDCRSVGDTARASTHSEDSVSHRRRGLERE